MPQAVASSSCKGLDNGRAHLVDIDDQEENTLIANLVAANGIVTVWTGMGDIQTGESHTYAPKHTGRHTHTHVCNCMYVYMYVRIVLYVY